MNDPSVFSEQFRITRILTRHMPLKNHRFVFFSIFISTATAIISFPFAQRPRGQDCEPQMKTSSTSTCHDSFVLSSRTMILRNF